MDNKEYYKMIIREHKSHITTVSRWNDYAKVHNLPLSHQIISVFGSWNHFKEELGLPIRKSHYSKAELKQIALKYKEYIRRKHIWDKFSSKHGLPASSTFINAFGSWTQLKKEIGITNQKYKDNHFTKEEIKDMLKAHGSNYQNRTQWDQYAKKHNLPTYKTIRKYLSYEEMKNILKENKKPHNH